MVEGILKQVGDDDESIAKAQLAALVKAVDMMRPHAAEYENRGQLSLKAKAA